MMVPAQHSSLNQTFNKCVININGVAGSIHTDEMLNGHLGKITRGVSFDRVLRKVIEIAKQGPSLPVVCAWLNGSHTMCKL